MKRINLKKLFTAVFLCFALSGIANPYGIILVETCFQNFPTNIDGGTYTVLPQSPVTFYSSNLLDFNSFDIYDFTTGLYLTTVPNGQAYIVSADDPIQVVPNLINPGEYLPGGYGATIIEPKAPDFSFTEANPDGCIRFGESLNFSSTISQYPGLCSYQIRAENDQLGILGSSGNGWINISDNGYCDDDGDEYDPTFPNCRTVRIRLTLFACTFLDTLCPDSIDFTHDITVCCGECDPFGVGASDTVLKADHHAGMLEMETSPISVFPNPANQVINIQFVTQGMQGEDVNVSLINMNGQLEQQLQYQAQEGINLVELKTPDLPVGIYFLNIQMGEKNEFQKIEIMR